jgi:hypothetical protein
MEVSDPPGLTPFHELTLAGDDGVASAEAEPPAVDDEPGRDQVLRPIAV